MKDEIITKLAKASKDPEHELILEMLEYYGVIGLRELTDEQVAEFAKKKGVI